MGSANWPQVRQPRGIVKINGTPVPAWVLAEVSNNTNYQADTFRIVLATSKLPAAMNLKWFSEQTTIAVEIMFGFPPDPLKILESDLTSWITGNVDDIDHDLARGELTLTGRDLTALFIDTKTTEQFSNQTSSQIATLLAFRHELGVNFITRTSTVVGTYFKAEAVAVNSERSEWDLLTYLAQKEGMAVYVQGNDLYFVPVEDTSAKAYVLQWTPPDAKSSTPEFNGMGVHLSRNLNVARGIVVTATSFNAKTGKVLTATYPTGGTAIKPGSAKNRKQGYTFSLPNKTQQQLTDFAATKHRELTRHEMVLAARLPGDSLLTAKNTIQLQGTGSSWDQIYYPDTVTRRMSNSEGYVMDVHAKNHNTDSQVQL